MYKQVIVKCTYHPYSYPFVGISLNGTPDTDFYVLYLQRIFQFQLDIYIRKKKQQISIKTKKKNTKLY